MLFISCYFHKILGRHIREIEEDQRIADLLKILRERDIGENYSNTQSRDNLTAESLDPVRRVLISFSS